MKTHLSEKLLAGVNQLVRQFLVGENLLLRDPTCSKSRFQSYLVKTYYATKLLPGVNPLFRFGERKVFVYDVFKS